MSKKCAVIERVFLFEAEVMFSVLFCFLGEGRMSSEGGCFLTA